MRSRHYFSNLKLYCKACDELKVHNIYRKPGLFHFFCKTCGYSKKVAMGRLYKEKVQ